MYVCVCVITRNVSSCVGLAKELLFWSSVLYICVYAQSHKQYNATLRVEILGQLKWNLEGKFIPCDGFVLCNVVILHFG